MISSTRQLTLPDAQRAIYIDFECLATKPPHPALLGVLDRLHPDAFEQIVVDEWLAPARVAHSRLRVAEARAAVETLVATAATENRLIVAWSFFDRDRLIDAAPALRERIESLYRNALHTARPWRKALHPSCKIEREDEFAPKHTLNKYARLAGYRDAASLDDAEPAKWIRHVLKQLKAKDGRYRRVTAETKRDWHKLLAYNRHDCLALRHVVQKASRELECWRAYERTRFCVKDGTRRICFMAGSRSAKLDALLVRHSASSWAFITAWNPASVILSRAENDIRQTELARVLADLGHRTLPGEGVGEDRSWEPEQSLLVFGVSRRAATKIGRQFGQLAIVAGHRGSPARLLPCATTPDWCRQKTRAS